MYINKNKVIFIIFYSIYFGRRLKEVLNKAYTKALEQHASYFDTEHILSALLEDELIQK
ncbi:MAG: hypothetical protein DSY38_00420, partial [Fusobacteria bacterium]